MKTFCFFQQKTKRKLSRTEGNTRTPGRQGGHINSTTDSPLLNMKMLVNCRAQCTTLKTSLIIETYCSLNKTLVQKARKLKSQKS